MLRRRITKDPRESSSDKKPIEQTSIILIPAQAILPRTLTTRILDNPTKRDTPMLRIAALRLRPMQQLLGVVLTARHVARY